MRPMIHCVLDRFLLTEYQAHELQSSIRDDFESLSWELREREKENMNGPSGPPRRARGSRGWARSSRGRASPRGCSTRQL